MIGLFGCTQSYLVGSYFLDYNKKRGCCIIGEPLARDNKVRVLR